MSEDDKTQEIPDLSQLIKPNDTNSELFKAVTTFFEGIETKTDIENKHVNQIIKLIFFGEEVKRFEINDELPKLSQIINEQILKNFYKLRVSTQRKGRTDAFTFFNGTRQTNTEETGLLKRILGR